MDLRRHSRVPFAEPIVFVLKSKEASPPRHTGTSRDISLGGMFIETVMEGTQAAFGAEIVVHVHVPGEPQAYALPGIVRWVGKEGMGVQFGMLGARETHTITELVAAASR